MQKVFIIGNLTKEPDYRVMDGGNTVCSFTVAVNRHNKGGQAEADYFRVTAWGKLADVCGQYLKKGKKVGVIGTIKAVAYKDNDGEARCSLEMTAGEVEFLGTRDKTEAQDGNGES